MQIRKRILGQSAPSGTVMSTLYTVPSGWQAVTSTFVVCNRLASDATFRMAIVPSGTSIANENYQYYDLSAPANDTFKCTDGMTMSDGDKMLVYGSVTGLSFSLFGQENT